MLKQVTANSLKEKGISALAALISENHGVVITVRGVEKYAILPIEDYNQLRELELDAAIQEAQNDVASGRFFTGSVDDHLVRVRDV